jgi:hypothetical protein
MVIDRRAWLRIVHWYITVIVTIPKSLAWPLTAFAASLVDSALEGSRNLEMLLPSPIHISK